MMRRTTSPFLLAVCSFLLICAANAVEEWLYLPKQSTTGQMLETLDGKLKRYFSSTAVLPTRDLSANQIQYWLIKAEKSVIQKLPKEFAQWGDMVPNEIIEEEQDQPYGGKHSEENTYSNITEISDDFFSLGTQQDNAPSDLQLISWPKGEPFEYPMMGWPYYFDGLAGQDVHIYVIENGINNAHDEFQRMPNPPTDQDWIIADGTDPTRKDDSMDGHGTCVASKAVGHFGGVSKNSHLVIVKAKLNTLAVVSAYTKIIDDIKLTDRQRKAVVVHSRVSKKKSFELDAFVEFPLCNFVRRKMIEIQGLGVPIVAAAGNDARGLTRRYPVDAFPAILSTGSNSPVIAASAIDLQGQRAFFSQEVKPSEHPIYAPGQYVECAYASTNTSYDFRSGTSFAAPMVAGVIAFVLSDPPVEVDQGRDDEVTAKLVTYLESQRSRPLGSSENPPAIWNGNTQHYKNGAKSTQSNATTFHNIATGLPTS